MQSDTLAPRLGRLSPTAGTPAQTAAALLSKLVVGFARGDLELAQTALSELQAPGLSLQADVNSIIEMPFGGGLYHPLSAAAGTPLPHSLALAASQRLIELGASVNVLSRDCAGEHTPLSKALVLCNYPLAELLVQHGADPTVALLCTDMLESSRFDPEVVKWLLDRGAGVAVPPPGGLSGTNGDCGCSSCSRGSDHHCSALAPGTPGRVGARGGSSGARLGAVPATAVLLRKLAKHLHLSRQLSNLHVAACGEQERWLLRRAADCLTLLLAAGATPVGASSNAALATAAAALEPADWEAVRQAASRPPQWTPHNHSKLFPTAYRQTAQEVLKVALKGFTVPTTTACQPGDDSRPGDHSQHDQRQRQQPQRALRRTFYLDGNMVQCIVKHLAPCSQL